VIDASKLRLHQLKDQSVAAVTVCYDLTELINIEKMREKLLLEYTAADNDDEFRDDE
jgi:hypothetical protein